MRRGGWLLIGIASTVSSSCGAPVRPITEPAAPASRSSVETTPPSRANQAPAIKNATRPEQAQSAAPEQGAPAFPPPRFEPPHARSAKPEDGQWVPVGDASKGELAGQEPRLIYRTTVHPHPASKFITVTVVAIDLTRASLHLVAGTDEPESKAVPKQDRPALVPAEHQATLLAVFNGGWQTRHGHWGVMVDGRVFVPPKPEGCTLAIHRDQSLRLASWTALDAKEAELIAYRQTPPCLLENGALHPRLAAHDDRPWGGNNPKLKTRRRSAIALDGTRSVLFYGFGDEASARELAEGLRIAGAAHAAELDINHSWTRFLLPGRPPPNGALQITSTLVPDMTHRTLGYVSKPEPRDFFYVKRR